MNQSLNCPSCGGTLDYGGRGRTMRCPYCGTTVQIPPELWQPFEQEQRVSQWKNSVVIFLILTVGLPTCLGLLGTLLGIGGSIFAVILPFVLRVFVH